MPVERRHRVEALDQRQQRRTIRRGPAPGQVDREQGHVAEEHQRRVRGQACKVLPDEGELLGAEDPLPLAHEAGVVDQGEEVDPFEVEAQVAAAARALAAVLPVALALIQEDGVLAGDVEDAIRFDRAQDLPGRIECADLAQVDVVACMDDEGRALGQGVDVADGRLTVH